MSKYTKQEVEEARANLLKWLKSGDTVYTILRHVSASGMTRDISPVLLLRGKKDKEPTPIFPAWSIGAVLDWPQSENRAYNSVRVGGCGMDMGFHLVYSLAQALFKDGYALKHRWL